MKARKGSPKKKPHSQGQVRIIGGEWRGRKLPVPEIAGLRPTSDRVRETLFNWLQFELPGCVCLDLFAGAGSLGFESLSRGAAQVCFVEKDARVAQQLQRNVEQLQTEHARIVRDDALHWLASADLTRFDLVFVDPPFNQGLLEPVMAQLLSDSALKPGAWLYLEQEKSKDWPSFPPQWSLYREKLTAEVRFGLWHKSAL